MKKKTIISQMRERIIALNGATITGFEINDMYMSLGGAYSKAIYQRSGNKEISGGKFYYLYYNIPLVCVTQSKWGSSYSKHCVYRYNTEATVVSQIHKSYSRDIWSKF